MSAENGTGGGRTDGPSRAPMSDEQFESLLARALEVDVPEPAPAQRVAGPPRRAVLPRWAGLAAGIALVVGVLVFQLRPPAVTEGGLPGDVIAHVHHEPRALVRTDEAVSAAAFERVMRAAGVELEPTVGTVSYVKLCPFRGELVAHFVVQGRSGPVTVLLLPDEEVAEPVAVEEDGFRGVIAPLAVGGSIAIVGEPGDEIDEIQNRVADAVRWRL